MTSSFVLSLFLLITTGILAGASTQYKVGNDDGWRLPDEKNIDMYSSWAAKISFQVGDSLVFQYQNDSVVKVDKIGYYHCNESSREPAFKDGNTVFLLDKPGFYYFVSGDLEHCKKGQRLMIEVKGPGTPPGAASPAPSPVPSGAVSYFKMVPSKMMMLTIAMAMFWLPSYLPF